MTTLPRLGATELALSQGAPETTVNELARYLEQGAGHFIFKDRDLATPPGSPADADCYLVAASPTGAWSGKAGKIAFYLNTAWAFITAREGFSAYINDEDLLVAYNGAAWVSGTVTASTTEQLTGTDAAKASTADSVAALWEQGSDVASAATVSLGEGGYFNVTGTTTITDIDFATDKAGRKAWVKFAGVLTLTHNASTLILPTGANIATAAGDTACFISEGADVVRCVAYNRASGAALTASSTTFASTTEQLTGTESAKASTPDSVAALWEQGSDVASAATVSLGEGGYFNVTGTTTITDIDFATDKAGRKAWVKFAGVLTLTHNASTLILPTGANITTAAGDTACFISEGSDVVRCVAYNRASGVALTASGTTFASTTEQLTGTEASKASNPDSVAALWEQGSDVASAATVSLGEGGYFNVTGTTTITDIDFATDKAGRKAWVKFAGVLTLTHNASTLILPTGANIATAAGDTACFISEGADVVRCVAYNRASGAALTASGSFASAAEIRTGTEAAKSIAPDQLVASAAPQTLTDGATINWDMASGFNAKVTLGGNRTMAAPTNPKVGLSYALEAIQDGTGSRTLTWNTAFKWGSAGTPTLSTAAGKRDLVFLYCYDASTPEFRATFNKDA